MRSLECRDAARPELPYDLGEPTDEREITRALMKRSAQALSKYVDDERTYIDEGNIVVVHSGYGPKFHQTQARYYSSRDKT